MQFETHQNYHFQIIGQNKLKISEKSPKWGLYGPQRQFSPQLKVLIFGTCTKNILMCSQVKFEADKPHSL